MTGPLAVIGAINVDLVVTGARLPQPGETVTGGSFARHHGGKGGNQAVAAARVLDARSGVADDPAVVLIGAVGDDDLGSSVLGSLADEGVLPSVAVLHGVPTGVALIVVDAAGENQIAVAPGANAHVSRSQVRRALDLHEPSVVLASLEVPEEAARAGAEWSDARGIPFVLNPAPTQPWGATLVPLATHVTPNEGELRGLGDIPKRAAVVETRGAGGVRIHGWGGEGRDVDVPAPRVAAVDTTGAGDCFNGVLAASLLEGLELRDAVARAVTAAALSTTRPGARDGMPTRAEIDAAIR